jgi:hypothetical protein
MGLYTFFMDFEGGTYASQVRANSPTEALKVWAETKLSGYSELLGVNITSQCIEYAYKEGIVALEGLKNTWCGSFMIEDGHALINLIQTVE